MSVLKEIVKAHSIQITCSELKGNLTVNKFAEPAPIDDIFTHKWKKAESTYTIKSPWSNVFTCPCGCVLNINCPYDPDNNFIEDEYFVRIVIKKAENYNNNRVSCDLTEEEHMVADIIS